MKLESRSYTTGHFELLIDGHATTAYVKSVDGGHIKATPVDEPIGSSTHRVKHTSTVDIEPISIEMGVADANDVLTWIEKSWKQKFERRHGQITHANFDLFPTFEHEFFEALITETTFPALDGSSKDPAYLKLKIQPEYVKQRKAASKQRLQPRYPKNQKTWSPSNFRFSIEGIPEMLYTNKIESFTVKQGIKKHYTGEDRFFQVEPTKIEFPGLSFTIALEYADKLLAWHEQYVNKGQRDNKAQKHGSIEFLSPDLKKTLFEIRLFEMGLHTCHVVSSTANADPIKRVKGEVYVGRMEIDLGGGAFG